MRLPGATPDFAAARARMVAQQLRRRGIADERVLAAMGEVPREAFVAPRQRSYAYADSALPIGESQTISQPWIVAAICQALELEGEERVLEVGSGSGYSTSVLAQLAREVIGIELRPALAAAGIAPFLERGRPDDFGADAYPAIDNRNARAFAAGRDVEVLHPRPLDWWRQITRINRRASKRTDRPPQRRAGNLAAERRDALWQQFRTNLRADIAEDKLGHQSAPGNENAAAMRRRHHGTRRVSQTDRPQ